MHIKIPPPGPTGDSLKVSKLFSSTYSSSYKPGVCIVPVVKLLSLVECLPVKFPTKRVTYLAKFRADCRTGCYRYHVACLLSRCNEQTNHSVETSQFTTCTVYSAAQQISMMFTHLKLWENTEAKKCLFSSILIKDLVVYRTQNADVRQAGSAENNI